MNFEYYSKTFKSPLSKGLMMALFSLIILANSGFQNESSKESKIKAGLPLIARYYDSLSFKKGNAHVSLFFVKPVFNVNNCDSFNYCILPLKIKEDLYFQKFNYYLNIANRKFILDQYFDSIVAHKYPISDKMRQSLSHNLTNGDWVNICHRKVLYYIDCNSEKYIITNYTESNEIIDGKLMPIPLRKWGK